MRLIACLLPVLAGLAAAGTIQECAGSCIGKAITATNCSSRDSSCICSSSAFLDTVNQCALTSCSEAEVSSALTLAEGFCNTVVGEEHEPSSDLKRDASPEPWKPSHKSYGHGRKSWWNRFWRNFRKGHKGRKPHKPHRPDGPEKYDPHHPKHPHHHHKHHTKTHTKTYTRPHHTKTHHHTRTHPGHYPTQTVIY